MSLFEDVDPHDPLFYAEVAEPQSLNKYTYCLNSPFKFVDPDGHQYRMADNLKIARWVGQTLKDTGIGAAKGAANIVIDTANAINTDINRVLPGDPVPYGQRFEASTTGERGAMFGVNVVAVIQGGRSAVAAAENIVTVGRTTAITSEMRAATSGGTVSAGLGRSATTKTSGLQGQKTSTTVTDQAGYFLVKLLLISPGK